jgi:site-specific DNA-methyltransferase (adenine-specific)
MKPYYERDGITIWHGDCREILPTIGVVDLVVTDPPYAVSVEGSTQRGKPGKGSRNLDFFEGDADWPAMIARVTESLGLAADALKPTGSLYAWVGHRQFGPVTTLLEERGFSTRFIVWSKDCPPPAAPNSGWVSAAELCLYGYRAGRTWNDAQRSNVLTSDSYRYGQPGKVAHPTQKPLSVMRTPMLASSAEGDLVLDPFAGSGTTLVSALESNRRAIGIEIEERYCEIAAKRLAQGVLDFSGVS